MNTVSSSLHQAIRSKALLAVIMIALLAVIALLSALVQPSVVLKISDSTITTRNEILRAADSHFDNPFEDVLTLKMTVTEQQGNGYVVTAWTLLGLPLERALEVPNESGTTL